MGLDEALLVLELSAVPDEQQGRRAYLRQVKRFKPDSDPVNFRRVREAYETLQRHWATASALEGEEASAEASAPIASGSDASAPPSTEARRPSTPPLPSIAVVPRGAGSPGEPSPVDDEDGSFGDDSPDFDLGPAWSNDFAQLLDEGEYTRAAALFQLHLNADVVPESDLELGYQLVLQLEGLGHREQAAELRGAVDAYLERNALEPELLRHRAGWRAALLAELDGERQHLSGRIWSLLALTAAGFVNAPDTNATLTLVAQQEMTWRERDRFRERSPNLEQILAAAENRPKTKPSWFSIVFPLLLFVSAVVPSVTRSCSEASRTPAVSELQGATAALIAMADIVGEQATSSSARALARALNAKDCRSAWELLRRTEARVVRTSSRGRLDPLLAKVHQQVQAQCPAGQESEPPP